MRGNNSFPFCKTKTTHCRKQGRKSGTYRSKEGTRQGPSLFAWSGAPAGRHTPTANVGGRPSAGSASRTLRMASQAVCQAWDNPAGIFLRRKRMVVIDAVFTDFTSLKLKCDNYNYNDCLDIVITLLTKLIHHSHSYTS